jgi:hypothetical protein
MFGVGVIAAASTGRADDCFAAPNSPAPQGSHWHYRSDRATQRKCWYLRGPDQPPQQAAAPATTGPTTAAHSKPAQFEPKPAADDAPVSGSPGKPKPAADVKALAKPRAEIDIRVPQASASSETRAQANASPAPGIGATTDTVVQQTAQEGNAAPSIPQVPAPQASTLSEISAQAAAPPPVARPPLVKAQDPIPVPADAPADSVFPDAERTAQLESTNSLGIEVIGFFILALGLAVVGIVSRFVMKNAAARRARNIIDRPEPDPYDTPEFYRLLRQDGPFNRPIKAVH